MDILEWLGQKRLEERHDIEPTVIYSTLREAAFRAVGHKYSALTIIDNNPDVVEGPVMFTSDSVFSLILRERAKTEKAEDGLPTGERAAVDCEVNQTLAVMKRSSGDFMKKASNAEVASWIDIEASRVLLNSHDKLDKERQRSGLLRIAAIALNQLGKDQNV